VSCWTGFAPLHELISLATLFSDADALCSHTASSEVVVFVCISVHLFGCFTRSTHPLKDEFFLSVSPFIHPTDLIPAISVSAHFFYIPPSFRLADKAISG